MLRLLLKKLNPGNEIPLLDPQLHVTGALELCFNDGNDQEAKIRKDYCYNDNVSYMSRQQLHTESGLTFDK